MNRDGLEEKLTFLDELQSSCTYCGLCSEGCATFQSTGWEHDSPRGRLKLANQLIHGNISIDAKSEALFTFDRCLGCRSCEILCPHQVKYSEVRKLVQEIRRELQLPASSAMPPSTYQEWITLAYRISNRWWRRLAARWIKLPFTKERSRGSFVWDRKRDKENKGAVLVVCCVQDLFHHRAIQQILELARLLGEELYVDSKQPCCGAIFERLAQGGGESVAHKKLQGKAEHLQNRTREQFLKWKPQKSYFLTRGCQAYISPWMKSQDQEVDLYGWLDSVLERKGYRLQLKEPKVVYYQPYCRFSNGEGDSILRLLHRIEGLTVYDLPHSDSCCGGFCGESLLHPENASSMTRRKIEGLPLGATVVVSSIDCWGAFKLQALSKQINICTPLDCFTDLSNSTSWLG